MPDLRKLLDPLVRMYGEPRDLAAVMEAVTKQLPEGIGDSQLEAAAERIISTRKTRFFPLVSELISYLKHIPRPSAEDARHSSQPESHRRSDARDRALRLLRGTDIAQRAVNERWSPELIDWVREHGREPGLDEEGEIIARAQRHDRGAAESWLNGVKVLRETMHRASARRLGDLTPLSPQPQGSAVGDDDWNFELEDV